MLVINNKNISPFESENLLVVDNHVTSQMMDHVSSNCLDEVLQSAYKQFHSMHRDCFSQNTQ